MEAVYRLNKSPATFNFVEFVCAAKTMGATSVVFDDSMGYRNKFTFEASRRRMETIVEPLCALAGMPFRYGHADEAAIDCGYGMKNNYVLFKDLGRIEKLKTVKPAGKHRITITIRNQQRHDDRNSNRETWDRVAVELNAHVIEDYDDRPIALHDRMAIYAGAEMNYFVANGPVALCLWSDYPYTLFVRRNEDSFLRPKYCPGMQLPWAVDGQKIVISPDEYEFVGPEIERFR